VLINRPKSCLTPTQVLDHLGFTVDTSRMIFAVTARRRARLLAVASDLLREADTHAGHVNARAASRVAGHILSLYLALGVVTRLRTRYLYRDLLPVSTSSTRAAWNRRIRLSDAAYKDVAFWRENLEQLPPTAIQAAPPCPRHVLYTDAGDDGWGAALHLNSGYFPPDCAPPGEPPRETRGSFSLSEKAGSSTWRELLGLLRALRTFTPVLQGHEVLLRTDSQAAVRIWHKGGSQALSETGELSIHPLILDLDHRFKDHDIRPIFQWVPRDLNELADFWSKFKDPGDWTLCDAQFRRLELRWGPHSVDRMASAENHKLPRFFSRFYAQGTEGSTASWSRTGRPRTIMFTPTRMSYPG
jgi:ribonuclease HI